jgi:gamma-glutamyltranspeptidase/glutathione hydrolase
MGDPDFSKIPVAQLIDKKYAAAWRETIDPTHASASQELKRPAIFNELEQYAAAHPPVAPPESNHTTHYSVVDCRRKRGGRDHHHQRYGSDRASPPTAWAFC